MSSNSLGGKKRIYHPGLQMKWVQIGDGVQALHQITSDWGCSLISQFHSAMVGILNTPEESSETRHCYIQVSNQSLQLEDDRII